ncbi:fimbrillin family protein [Bacteroides gallinarum]|uniref:fimbrillin family protein n=2 Tax=Bacteroides gallinarum TaxID=376806 RepID=UPI000382F07A|nr:fimbrillin family protein [Bacteroides gallinarum]
MTDKHTGRAGLNVPFPVTKTLSGRLSEAQTEKNEKECCDMMERIRQQVFTGTLRRAALLLAVGSLLASCSKEYDGPISSSAERELRFSVSQQGEAGAERAATRAMPVETDDFHESFGVFGYSYPSGSEWTQAAPKFMYNIEASREDGTDYATADTYFVPGEGTDVTFLAYAPYEAEGLTVPQKEITGAPTYAYTVPADVTKQSDLCFAASVTLNGGTEDGTVKLTFAHALTAVSFIEGSEMAQGTITGISLKGLYGSATYNTGNTETNKWTSFSTPDSEFSQMLNVSVPNSEGKAITTKEQTFMLLPQTLGDGAELVIDYTPQNEEPRTLTASLKGKQWQPGDHVTYTIKILDDKLVIESVKVTEWGVGQEINVPITRSYAPETLKVGDYLYADGTWSDGGLRRIDAGGSYVIAAPKPTPIENKQVVGIVYLVYDEHPDRFGKEEKATLQRLGIEPHGLVMSVKNVALLEEWGPEGIDEELNKCETKADNYNDISGLYNCNRIKTNRGSFDVYPAFKAVDDYNENCPVANTTGWYLPASGQWWDIMQYLAKVPGLSDPAQQSDTNDIGTGAEPRRTYEWSSPHNPVVALNAWMVKIDDSDKDVFNSDKGQWFWSSSEYNNKHARFWQVMNNSKTSCIYNYKEGSQDVRPVLAF